MAKNNYYAVKIGIVPGIYSSWDETKRNVNGYPNSDFKGFKTLDEAEKYMEGVNEYIVNAKNPVKPQIDTDLTGLINDEKDVEIELTSAIEGVEYATIIEEKSKTIVSDEEDAADHTGIINIYTDGSFKDSKVGYGIVVTKDNKVISKLGGNVHCEDMTSRNIIGEVEGVIKAVEYCFANGINEVVINYDYIGLERWYTGAFKAKSDIAKYYVNKMNRFSNYVNIHFNKIKGHSGDTFNEMADDIARRFTLLDLI